MSSKVNMAAENLANQIAARYANIPEVEAVALGGSRISPFADEQSDIDLYIYISETMSLTARAEIPIGTRRAEIGNDFWEPGDEWIDDGTGVSVDVMFRTTPWIEDRLDRVLRRHEASIGYSTCFWYNVRNSRPLFDRTGWFAAIQQKANQQYSPNLQRAIIAKNWPILRSNLSSYLSQIELAISRNDKVSVNHRLTALLASYFDIVFAINKQPHPGEKRLLQFTQVSCPNRPDHMEEHILALLASTHPELVKSTNTLLDNLERLLKSEHLLPLS